MLYKHILINISFTFYDLMIILELIYISRLIKVENLQLIERN